MAAPAFVIIPLLLAVFSVRPSFFAEETRQRSGYIEQTAVMRGVSHELATDLNERALSDQVSFVSLDTNRERRDTTIGDKAGRKLGTECSPSGKNGANDSQLEKWCDHLFKGKWGSNSPVYRNNYYIALYVRDQAHVKTNRQLVLIVGGRGADDVIINETWVYTHWTNSWYMSHHMAVESKSHPVLPTLCGTDVIMVNGFSDVWAFDGRLERWSRLAFRQPEPFLESHFPPIFGTIANTASKASCRCGMSVFLYGTNSTSPLSLQVYELTCVNVTDNNYCQEYEWVNRSKNLEPGRAQKECQLNNSEGIEFYANSNETGFDIHFLRSGDDNRCTWRYSVQPALYGNSSLSNNINGPIIFDIGSPSSTKDRIILGKWVNLQISDSLALGFLWQINDVLSCLTEQKMIVWVNDSESVEWRKREQSRDSPDPMQFHASVVDSWSNNLYLLGRYHLGTQEISQTEVTLWTLNIESKTWWQRSPATGPTATYSNCVAFVGDSYLVLFGGFYTNGMNTTSNELWVFDVNTRLWQRNDKSIISISRADCSLAAVPGRKQAILFGGFDGNKSHSDVWNISFSDDGVAEWTEVSTVGRSPSPRRHHCAIILGDTSRMLIYGGMSSNYSGVYNYTNEVWSFDLEKKLWTLLGYSSPSERVSTSGMYPPYSQWKISMLPYRYRSVAVSQMRQDMEPTNFTLTLLNVTADNLEEEKMIYLPHPFTVQASGVWRNSLFFYGYRNATAFQQGFYTITPGCQPGFFLNASRCRPCQKGTYSSGRSMKCEECPEGTTTESATSASSRECKCDVNYCSRGECSIKTTKKRLSPMCSCSFGFVGKRCDEVHLGLYVIPVCIVIVMTLTVTIAVCGVRNRKHRSTKKRTRKQLEETRRAFTIQHDEIQLQDRLDGDCPGGYGQVHRARYRDWTVAVKQLQVAMAENDEIRMDFVREIEFMRTVRHPNIVMFLGAGKFRDQSAFLVLEFMSNGALHSVLLNTDIHLTMTQKIQFCLDTAEGMDYLHSLNPARIHRDLKSSNLLLSSDMHVKVADFGSARLIPKLNTSSRNVDRDRMTKGNLPEQTLSERIPLTVRHVGTPRWRSPEVWKRRQYGTSSDVYR